MNALERLNAGKYLAYEAAPYFRPPLGCLPVVWTREVPYMGVDKWWRLYVNPDTIHEFTPAEVGFVLVHEVSHLLRDHHGRAQANGFDPQIANIAWDCEINDMQYHGLKFPTCGVRARDYNLTPHLLGEEYYWKLVDQQQQKKQQQKQQQQQKGQQGNGEGQQQQQSNADGQGSDGDESTDGNGQQSAKGKDDVRQADGGGSEGAGTEDGGKTGSSSGRGKERSQKPVFGGSGSDGVRRKWELDPKAEGKEGLSDLEIAAKKLETAVEIEKHEASTGRGTIAGGWKKWAESVLRPKVRVDKLLRAAVCNGLSKCGIGDKTYRRTRRQGDILLPRHSRRQPVVAVVCDTSGSMGSGEDTPMHKALSMVIAIARNLGGVNVIWQDTRPHLQRNVRTIKQVEALGGGGTDMSIGIRYADTLKNGDRADVIVCVTDCATPWPDTATRAPLVIVDATGGKGQGAPSWAKVVSYE